MKNFIAGLALALAAFAITGPASAGDDTSMEKAVIPVQYLEIVTEDVETTCQILAKQHDVTFSDPQPGLGTARVADLAGGGRIGVRPPLSAEETPVVRPYLLVDDIEVAIADVQAAGGEFAMLATDIPGQGKFAIYFLGGIQHGLWER
ncbi:VOC family protein [Parvularcula sp. IMCC14364]|uniref:VOC family protein n=1 Tax=Parvularcula sp. IMCC14364 TaxID=3067902 RepID=UPI0027428B08|nr:hypothetical protein [Parvularcula sp. IMCC14364]